jgi:hypothetical protein
LIHIFHSLFLYNALNILQTGSRLRLKFLCYGIYTQRVKVLQAGGVLAQAAVKRQRGAWSMHHPPAPANFFNAEYID